MFGQFFLVLHITSDIALRVLMPLHSIHVSSILPDERALKSECTMWQKQYLLMLFVCFL